MLVWINKNLENSNHLFDRWICVVASRNSDNLSKILCITFVHNNVAFVISN